jgi:tRNA(Ile)-lysidine synthase
VSHLVDALALLPREVLVAVSGGLDSMALLHAVVATGRQAQVVHVDHRWRPNSAEDAQWVRRQAAARGCPTHVLRLPKDVRMTESAAREGRWAAFRQAAERSGLPHLVVAHHADDQAETLLLQLARGAGSGLRGMRPRQQMGILQVHRPWLKVRRTAILAYADQQGLLWREDPSNDDVRHLRNRIRQQVIPYLSRALERDVVGGLTRAAEILGAEDDWMEAMTARFAASDRLRTKELASLPMGAARRVVRAWLQRKGVADVSFADIENVRRLALKRDPARINLSGCRHARRREGFIDVVPVAATASLPA